MTVNYELSNYATVANTREDPNYGNYYWGSINRNMTRELYVRNRVLESEAFSNVEAAFGATPDVSDPPAYPMSATCELFMMAGSVEEAAAEITEASSACSAVQHLDQEVVSHADGVGDESQRDAGGAPSAAGR